MSNSNIVVERLRQNSGSQSGCSVLFLKSLKSDLAKILRQYMSLGAIDFDIDEREGGYNLCIRVSTDEFFDIGMGEG